MENPRSCDEEAGSSKTRQAPSRAEEPELSAALSFLAAAVAAELRRAQRRIAAFAAGSLGKTRLWAREARPAVAAAALLSLSAVATARRMVSVAPRLRAERPAFNRPAGPRRFHRLRRLLFVFLAVLATGFVGAVVFLGYCAFTLPLSGGLAAPATPAEIIFETADGKPFATRGVYKGRPVTYAELPKNLIEAVVAIEDRRFFENPGIDLWGIARAAVHDILTDSESQGASTITQQLVRLTFLSPQRTIRRKVQEAMLALWLETRLSKKEILARYLNAAYFGAGAYGIDAAARRYFGKSVRSLNLSEAAMLAGLIVAPSALAPTQNLAGAQRRADTVLRAMRSVGFINRREEAAAEAHPAAPKVSPATPQAKPDENYFVDTAENEVKGLLGTLPTDLTVRTTLDPRLQQAAESVVQRGLAREGRARHVGEAALVALSPSGAILAMVGGRNYDKSRFNRVTEARRPPGSLFKIFVYLTALEQGYTPQSVMVDQPVAIGNWHPRDYERRYLGPVTLETAFAQSINTVSVQLAQKVGIENVIKTARSLGVRSPLEPFPSLALGSEGVTLLEMTRAMAAIADDAKNLKSYTVRAIYAHHKTPLYTHEAALLGRPSWNDSEMKELLRAVVSSGTARNAALSVPVAGKTGTTNDYRDAWFVGFTSNFVVGVWVGNDNDSPMRGVVGGDLPAKIWHDFVAKAERIREEEAEGPRVAAARAPSALLADGVIEGVPLVLDTGTLVINDRTVHLAGVEGESGKAARDMARYIAGRQVTCEPLGGAGGYRCRVGGHDLGDVVVFNGGGLAAADASPSLKIAEEEAREAGRGVWAR